MISFRMEICEEIFSLHGKSVNQRQIRAIYGISFETMIILWQFLKKTDVFFKIKPIYLLWTLYFLKNYPTCDIAANHFKVDAKTFQLYVWRILFLLYIYFDTVSYLLKRF